MGHTTKYKQKLIARMKRIRGQMDAVERALDNGTDCAEVLQLIAAARGAMNGLMAELIEGLRRAVEPLHAVGRRQRGDLLDPREQLGVLGRGGRLDHAAVAPWMSWSVEGKVIQLTQKALLGARTIRTGTPARCSITRPRTLGKFV